MAHFKTIFLTLMLEYVNLARKKVKFKTDVLDVSNLFLSNFGKQF